MALRVTFIERAVSMENAVDPLIKKSKLTSSLVVLPLALLAALAQGCASLLVRSPDPLPAFVPPADWPQAEAQGFADALSRCRRKAEDERNVAQKDLGAASWGLLGIPLFGASIPMVIGASVAGANHETEKQIGLGVAGGGVLVAQAALLGVWIVRGLPGLQASLYERKFTDLILRKEIDVRRRMEDADSAFADEGKRQEILRTETRALREGCAY